MTLNLKIGDRVWYTANGDRKDTGTIVSFYPDGDARVHYDSGEIAPTAPKDLAKIEDGKARS